MMNTVAKYKSYLNRESFSQTLDKVNDSYSQARDVWNKIYFLTDKRGISGLEFHIRKTEQLSYSNNITDYTLENGSVVQQASTPQPLVITLSGVWGDNLFYKKPKRTLLNKVLSEPLQKLSLLNSEFSQQAQTYLHRIDDITNKVNSYIEKTGDILSYIKQLVDGNYTNNQQRRYYSELMTLARSRNNLLTVKTDYCDLNNMMIQDVKWGSVDNTINKSEVSITLKQVEFTSTILSDTRKSDAVKNSIGARSNNGKDNGSLNPPHRKMLKIGDKLSEWRNK